MEETFSRPFLDENQFRLVSQDRVRSQNRIGCLVFVSRTVLSCLTHSPLINAECQEDSIVFLLKRPKWISHRWNFEFLFVQDWSRRSHQWQTTTIKLQLNGFQKDFLNQAKMDLSILKIFYISGPAWGSLQSQCFYYKWRFAITVLLLQVEICFK